MSAVVASDAGAVCYVPFLPCKYRASSGELPLDIGPFVIRLYFGSAVLNSALRRPHQPFHSVDGGWYHHSAENDIWSDGYRSDNAGNETYALDDAVDDGSVVQQLLVRIELLLFPL